MKSHGGEVLFLHYLNIKGLGLGEFPYFDSKIWFQVFKMKGKSRTQ